MSNDREHGTTDPARIEFAFHNPAFHNPGAFWFGAVATTVGVLLHLPMYVAGRSMGYQLVGMPVDAPMAIGMLLIVVGLVATFFGIYPQYSAQPAKSIVHIQVRALDDAPMRAA